MELHKPELDKMKLYVYRRPLHPELFTICLDKHIQMERYEASLWLIGTGHLVSFHSGDYSISELLTDNRELLPEKGLLEEFSMERSGEYQVSYENIIYYMVSMQSERMSQAVFDRTCEEMHKFARNRGLFMVFEQWAEERKPAPFSLIDYEKRPNELDVFTYHVFVEERVLLRTQSVFSLEPVDTGLPSPFKLPGEGERG
jgi:hypothetical protein